MVRAIMPTEAPARPLPRLFLVTPPEAGDGFAETLADACRAGDVASVLVWGEASDPRGYAKIAKTLVAAVQAAGAAALLRADTQLVGRVGADGFHCDGDSDALREAIEQLQPERIVGAANLRSRHDAMEAGEAGADYVFFGNLAPGEARGNALDLLIERAEWWQPIFEMPCVVYAPTLDAVGPIAAAGADFVALREAIWSATDPNVALRAATDAIRAAFARTPA